MKRIHFLILASIFAASICGAAAADEHPVGSPKIDRAAAEKLALSAVPNGRVKEGELEREHGRLVWSFDIAQPNTPNVTEVQVDANEGKIVSIQTETPDDQAKESKDEHAKSPSTPGR